MRGRKPSGPAVAQRLAGSALARQRLQVVLETLAGTCRVQEACARLHISEQRFDQLRTQVLQAGLDSLEPRRAGRRPQVVPAAEVQALQARVSELEIELRAARVREEIALALPAVGVTATEPAKKSPRRRSSAQRRAGRRDQRPPSPQRRRGLEARLIASSAAAGAGHLERLQVLCSTAPAAAATLPRRGSFWQQPRRCLEEQVRQQRVAFRQWVAEQGLTRIERAAWLGISARTLRDWEQRLRSGATMVPVLGRPVLRLGASGAEQAVLELLVSVGPGVGLAVLAGQFPEMPRAELADLLRRYRRIWIRRHAQWLHVLHWQYPGTVWAIDYARPPLPPGGGVHRPVGGARPGQRHAVAVAAGARGDGHHDDRGSAVVIHALRSAIGTKA